MLLNILYFLGSLVFWGGAIFQVWRMLVRKTVKDIDFKYVVSLVIGHALLFPRAISSPVIVWKIGIGISLFLSIIIGIIYLIFRDENNILD